ncbi:MAG: HD domain-containing protein [Candidatus Omnitrophica bacterium]|nr:HD domain-containing protein [Candidatus Omnitrophota bacterium]MBU1932810.1 HD domain-containing protein [Candidatus Omnitrophota bacterium]
MQKVYQGEVFFTPKQAAEYFNLSLSTIKNYIYAKKLKTLKTPGGHHRIRRSELLASLGEREEKYHAQEDSMVNMNICSNVLVNAFKALGPAGELLILHSRNVSRISHDLARELAFTDREIALAKIAGILHDIGHIASKKKILYRKGGISERDYELLKAHASRGKEILAAIENFKDIADIVGQHHERPDGRGYPLGLKGDQINKLSRVLSIAEAYDTMVAPYSYKKSLSRKQAIDELIRNLATQFDSEIVEVFVKTL